MWWVFDLYCYLFWWRGVCCAGSCVYSQPDSATLSTVQTFSSLVLAYFTSSSYWCAIYFCTVAGVLKYHCRQPDARSRRGSGGVGGTSYCLSQLGIAQLRVFSPTQLALENKAKFSSFTYELFRWRCFELRKNV